MKKYFTTSILWVFFVILSVVIIAAGCVSTPESEMDAAVDASDTNESSDTDSESKSLESKQPEPEPESVSSNEPPVPDDAIYKNPEAPIKDRVTDILSRMTLAEKIGQMTQIERGYISPLRDITKYGLGSLLSGGGSGPIPSIARKWADMYDEFQSYALKTRLGIPLIYGVDAVHGHNNVLRAVIFPHNIGLGATRNPVLVEKIARVTAIEVAGTGLDWTFAPCIAVCRNERWGRTYESFSEDPALVSKLGAAAIRGYQGSNLSDPATILATAKHYAGDGGTEDGRDQGNTVLSEEELMKIHVEPYKSALAVPVGSIMVSFSSWNEKKLHSHKYLITDVLKNKLGFKGFIISDWEGVKQLPDRSPEEQIRDAINAGIDMNMVPDNYRIFIKILKSLVEKGEVPESRIDDAVKRILTIKFKLGLFEKPYTDRSYTKLVGLPEHRELARQAVRESLVLLKNEKKVLPLSKKLNHIHIAGKKADDLGSQCGGWSITWQGQAGNITRGTTILKAIKDTVSPETKITFSQDIKDAEGADVIVVVVGENPYAEVNGDKKTLSLINAHKRTIENMQMTGIPVVVILISGRPIIVNSEIDKSSAFIAAWLPGTEGQGVADVLFGDYSPTGKLSFTWPKDMEQIPINVGDGKKDPLFPYGFGLTY